MVKHLGLQKVRLLFSRRPSFNSVPYLDVDLKGAVTVIQGNVPVIHKNIPAVNCRLKFIKHLVRYEMLHMKT